MKIKTGDKVKVLSGKDRGKTGKVIQVLRDMRKGQAYVVVENVNMRKKHLRAAKGEKGRIIELSAPMHISNVMMLDPTGNKPTRVGFVKDGKKKQRKTKKSGAVIE